MAGTTQQDTYSQPVQVRDATRRVGRVPYGQGMAADGYLENLPAPTGYYPDFYASGTSPWLTKQPVYPEQYQQTIYQDSLHAAETIDQHTVLHVSQTWVPPTNPERPSSRSDPAAAGLPRPDVDFVSNYFYRAAGTDGTRLLDVPGRTFPAVGVQDEVSWTWATSSRMQLAPYDPAQLVQTPDGRMEMPDTLRAIAPAGAHGWTAQPPVISQQELNDKAKKLQQQKNTDRNLIANSTYAGQSYGLRTRHVGGGPANVSVRGGTGNGR